MRISDWSSDVYSSDLRRADRCLDGYRVRVELRHVRHHRTGTELDRHEVRRDEVDIVAAIRDGVAAGHGERALVAAVDRGEHRVGQQHLVAHRSEEHTSELQSLMRISYAVFCLKKKTN